MSLCEEMSWFKVALQLRVCKVWSEKCVLLYLVCLDLFSTVHFLVNQILTWPHLWGVSHYLIQIGHLCYQRSVFRSMTGLNWWVVSIIWMMRGNLMKRCLMWHCSHVLISFLSHPVWNFLRSFSIYPSCFFSFCFVFSSSSPFDWLKWIDRPYLNSKS